MAGSLTMRLPVIQAGVVIFARRGIGCDVREAQLSGAAVRGRIVRRDIWGAPEGVKVNLQDRPQPRVSGGRW
jgi:hypothetical protein